MIQFATYASADYLPYLENCVRGCRHFLGIVPQVYAFDEATRQFALQLGCAVVDIVSCTCERHVYSLDILRNSPAQWTVLIDADCWPTHNLRLEDCVSRAEAMGVDFLGDLGQVDLAYLFKTTPRESMLVRLHELMQSFPRFTTAWGSRGAITPSRPAYGSLVVDLPLFYGGFALYRTAAFVDMTYPAWIHSADIWLSMFAFEKGLTSARLGMFQFNRSWENQELFVHLAGPKEDIPSVAVQDYRQWLSEQEGGAHALIV